MLPQTRVPLVGAGDLLRYNAGVPRPLTLYSMRLASLSGAAGPDLVGTWNYYHRPGAPISGVVCYPRLGEGVFGDLVRLRYAERRGDTEFKDFPGTDVDADFADVDGDGLVDLIFAERGKGTLTFFLNTGERTPGGMPVVDWDGDGLLDLVYSLAGTGHVYLLRNVGTRAEPLFAAPRQFKCYGQPLAYTIHGPNAWPADLNGDGKPDLLGCVEWSVYPCFAHAALELEEHPR